jgi:hypothetical protein
MSIDSMAGNGRHLARTIFASTALLAVSASYAHSGSQSVPVFAKPFAAEGDVILAAKATPALMGGAPGAVIIVRHALGADRSTNPCDLLILEGEQGHLSTVTSSRRVVDCQYNDIARRAEAMGLNDNLVIGPNEITYSNVLDKGGASYTFTYETGKAWRFSRAESTHVSPDESGEVAVYRSVVSYPKDIPLVLIETFEPKALRELVERNRAPVE